MIIKGKKVILRPMKEDDFKLLFEWFNDPKVMQFWYGRDKPRSKHWIKTHFVPSIKGLRDWTYWIIEFEKQPIGYMCNTAVKDDDGKILGRVEIDILIGDKTKWGQGFGSDALKAMLNYVFKKQEAERAFLTPRLANKRAIHVYKKAGFKKEGILRHYEKFEGKWVDNVIMSILREEFMNER